jgi:hypothetical protein
VHASPPFAERNGMETRGAAMRPGRSRRTSARSIPLRVPLPPGVFGATLLFSMGWSEGTSVRYIVFRNLEANYLKTENLQWRQRTTLRVKLRDRIRRLWSRQITLMDRLPDREQHSANRACK